MTDNDGAFVMSDLAPVNRVVTVSKPGYLTERSNVTMVGDTQIVVLLRPERTYILSGVVFELTDQGQVPLEGVHIYCDTCGSPTGHTDVQTDANGFYRLAWAAEGAHVLHVSKAGYRLPVQSGRTAVTVTATVRGDTRFDIHLVRP
jgi:hypothetical protein